MIPQDVKNLLARAGMANLPFQPANDRGRYCDPGRANVAGRSGRHEREWRYAAEAEKDAGLVNEAIAVGGYILLALCELAIAMFIVLGCAWLINRISRQK